ncbi:hypothetical protein P4O66_003293 [Electrophorus voltai]|uniref:Uncharacterized protein n=1 Tax=Electrophorus voltai TaxID=2609070 RepID=A0AAD8YP06_9TELE|nr:hypothetical protein P4O66_003293 [Electrophorus voltai]
MRRGAQRWLPELQLLGADVKQTDARAARSMDNRQMEKEQAPLADAGGRRSSGEAFRPKPPESSPAAPSQACRSAALCGKAVTGLLLIDVGRLFYVGVRYDGHGTAMISISLSCENKGCAAQISGLFERWAQREQTSPHSLPLFFSCELSKAVCVCSDMARLGGWLLVPACLCERRSPALPMRWLLPTALLLHPPIQHHTYATLDLWVSLAPGVLGVERG